jgi:sortase (surface protein transpeptidase)
VDTGARWWPVISVVLGLALLVGAPLVWWAARPPAEVGELPVPSPDTAEAADPPTEDVEPAVAAALSPTGGWEVPPHRTPPAAPADAATEEDVSRTVDEDPPAAPADVADPVRLEIGVLGIDAPVIAVGLNPDGSMEIPDDVDEVGWYAPGVRPGEAGSAVLAGHVDNRTQGKGAFFDIGRLEVDDTLVVVDAEGGRRTWAVVARRQYPKDELPVDELFVRGGPTTQLALITCGGAFDASARSYLDNIVVYAVPRTSAG